MHDTSPSYRSNNLPEWYNESKLGPTKLTLEGNSQVMKKLNLNQEKEIYWMELTEDEIIENLLNNANIIHETHLCLMDMDELLLLVHVILKHAGKESLYVIA